MENKISKCDLLLDAIKREIVLQILELNLMTWDKYGYLIKNQWNRDVRAEDRGYANGLIRSLRCVISQITENKFWEADLGFDREKCKWFVCIGTTVYYGRNDTRIID